MEKGINIGKNRWIPWVKIDTRGKDVFDADKLIEPTWDFWHTFETECVAECCGVDAFCFSPEAIERALVNFPRVFLIKDIKLMREEIRDCGFDMIGSSRFNQYFHTSLFIKFLDYVLSQIDTTGNDL